MKKLIGVFMLVLAVNTANTIQAQPGYAGEWKKTRLYGHTYASNGFTQEQYEFIRDHHEIFCFEKTHLNAVYGNPSHEESSKIEAAYLKSLNPRIKPITIYSIRRAYPLWNESTAEAMAAHPDWVTEISTGKWYWDLTNQARNDWYVETMNDLVNNSELEGIFIDGLEGVYSNYGDEAKSIMSQMDGLSLMNGFNPKTSTTFKTGPDFLEHCAGVFVDSWFRRELDTRQGAETMIDACIEVPEDKVLILFSGNNNDGIWGTDHTFSHAAYLIVAHKNTYYRWSGDGLWGSDVLMEYHEDFDKEMGKPLGKAVKDGYVYTRIFEHCFVTLDLENVTSSIVWGMNNGNLAYKGTASQSSTDSSRVASLAIDNNTSGVWSDSSLTSTTEEANPWWQVELEEEFHLGDIAIYNRTDVCCKENLSNFTVSVLNEAGETTFTQTFTEYPDSSMSINAAGNLGKTIRVELNGTGTLSLAEVEVYQVKKKFQDITFKELSVKRTFSSDFTPQATSSSGLEVVFVSSDTDVATIVDGSIHIVGSGTSTITASQPGNISYYAADDVKHNLVVVGNNLALSGTATQSSTGYSAPASLAVDGNTNGVFHDGSVSHTNTEENPWWQVDLGVNFTLDEIVIYNRTDACCKPRLSNYTVFVTDNDNNIVFSETYTSYPDPSNTIKVGLVEGRYVKIQLNGSTYALNLAEVQVFGKESSMEKNVQLLPRQNNELCVDVDVNDSLYLTERLFTDDLIWKETNRGSSYFSYQLLNTNYCIHGDMESADGQPVYVTTCDSEDQDQRWYKVEVDSGYYRLLKGSDSDYALSVGYDNSIQLQTSDKSNHQQYWANGTFSHLTIVVVDGHDLEKLSEATVLTNGHSLNTDSNGEAIIILADDQRYSISAEIAGYVSQNISLYIRKDTTISIHLARENYNLDLHVKDANTEEAVSYASVLLNETFSLTNPQGNLSLTLEGGEYVYTLSKEGYQEVTGTIILEKDTLVTYTLSQIPSGVNLSEYGIKIYPNPNSDILYVEGWNIGEELTYQIVNMVGIRVKEGLIKGSLDISELYPGMYFMYVKDTNRILHQHVLIKR